jgi:hypothetical protein
MVMPRIRNEIPPRKIVIIQMAPAMPTCKAITGCHPIDCMRHKLAANPGTVKIETAIRMPLAILL